MATQTREQGEWHDWVGELFAPAIDLDVEGILQGVDKDNAIKSKIKRVSVFDPETVKGIYEKVHMMTLLDRKMKEQLKPEECPGQQEVLQQQRLPKDARQVQIPKQKEEVDLNDSCIWSSEEIGVLRKVMKAVKDQNMQLKVRNRELEKQNSKLVKQNTTQVQEYEKVNSKLKEVVKANSRLKIHCDHLQSEFDTTNARMTAMEQVFKEISEEKASMAKQVQEIRINSDKERMEKTKIELKLDSLQREALSEKMSAVESIKLQCQGEILQLTQQIKDLTTELNKERKLHRTTKRGLDHLRNHFASLPMSHIMPPNSVHDDQVDQFQY